MVIQQLLTYAPQRFQGLTVVLFAFGALTYSLHPEGVLEFQKRRWTARFERLFLQPRQLAMSADGPPGAPGPLFEAGGKNA